MPAAGFGLKHCRPSFLGTFQPLIDLGGTRYPETMWKMFLINSPRVFTGAWSVIQKWVHPVTREKIKILGGPAQYAPALADIGVTLDQLPGDLGGSHPGRVLAGQ